MRSRVTTELLARAVALARADPEREVCGLLLAREGAVDLLPARNVAPDPRRRFEIDPATLLTAHRDQRRGGPAVIGCYHSHPSGSPEPSPRDAADAEPNGWLWLIVGRDGPRLWRAVPDGAIHGRFDPAPLACVDRPPAPETALSSKATL